MRAWVLIREAIWYRKRAFINGLKACGFEVLTSGPRGGSGNVLVQWNRYGPNNGLASLFEREGGQVLVAENGYLGRGGGTPKFEVYPKGAEAGHYYALGLGFHNDAERVIPGGPERFAALGVELKPWRADGNHVLVCPNRSFGVPGRMMPPDWPEKAAARLRKQTRREVRVRLHPGNDAPRRPLSEDLKGCWAVVVWSSSVAVHSLAAGVPTYIEAPYQILKGAGAMGPVDCPSMPERLTHFERMACGQFRIEEIESGAPFRHLLRAAGKS
jgi:hypothetical protein